MIGYVRGRLQSVRERGVLLDVNGVGYEVWMPVSCLARLPALGQEVTAFTHLVWKEEAVSLYGFDQPQTRDMFRVLIEVSGVGPRLALNVLSALSTEELLQTLARGETGKLQAVHGVGKKTAARLCVDLREWATLMVTGTQGPAGEERFQSGEQDLATLWDDANSALVHLGYRPGEAKGALARAFAALGEDAGLEKLVKHALQGLAKERRERP